ncbi:U3 small nucleolar RNA-associated protein 4 homolog isoform X2 [Plodia interpunctella]|uniref:U3 small nucleolar RNA-associated protein 4 homolog isoform X2 n=1 Tax=Plodia interpunctella TaxID=58824 RepID=UPI002367AC6B|nr:U3 small nucleolar RNA-associated protein 4 homolog isoform X2 [Plodia interpunctella]
MYSVKLNLDLAICRGDASIEIWDLAYAPYLIKFIPGVENGSVEALGWVNNRLLSTGLGGALVEWDLERSCVKATVLLTGYAAWCLDVNSDNTTVAVGTEQGYVNLYNVENDDIVYQKLFDKQEGRIMCCKFNSAGNILATGSINTIRVWNVKTGYAISRITVSRRGKDTIVWCLAVLADNMLVSGDSHGRLTFWDGTLGEQIESYSTHKADILSITVSDDEKSLYCSGVDPVLTNFIKVDNKQAGAQWVKHFQRHIHEHDVRALVYKDNKLISVGVDGYLTLSSYPPKWVMRIPHMIPAPRSSVCAKKKLLLLRYNKHLEVWKLGTFATNQNGKVLFDNINRHENLGSKDNTNSNTEEDSRIDILNKANMALNKERRKLKLVENPLKLVSIQTKGKKQLRCCELSPTGEFIVYSTDSNIRMLKLETDDDQTNTSISKMILNGLPPTCDRVTFTEDSLYMAVHNAGTLYILHVDSLAGATVVQTINIQKHLKTSSILHLYISKNTAAGKIYLVLADTVGAIVVFTKGEHKFEHYVTLPTYKCLPSALTVDSARDNLIVAYVDQKVVEYELVSKKFSDWLNSSLPAAWWARGGAVSGVSAHAQRAALVFKDDTSLWVLDRKPDENYEPQSKKQSKGEKKNAAFKVIPIKYLSDFHWIGDDEAVIVEILPENIVSQLPPIVTLK